MYSFFTKVVGTTFNGRDETIEELYLDGDLDCGQRLILDRERNNAHDKNAIAVKHPKNMKQLGFIGRDIAAKLAPVMDSGIDCYAEVQCVTGGNTGRYGINIKVIYDTLSNESAINQFCNTTNEAIQKITKFKIKVLLSQAQDVFSICVEGTKNGDMINSVYKSITEETEIIIEADFDKPIDKISVNFEEHLKTKCYHFPIPNDVIGGNFGIILKEKIDPNDSPTYVNTIAYLHPIFDYEIVDYSLI